MTPHQLVILNLEVLEQASKVAEELDEMVMRVIYRRVAQWADDQNGWWSDPDYDKHFCYFGPKNWPHDPEEDLYKAHFELGTTSKLNDEDYYHRLSALTGSVPVEFGIFFSVDAAWMTGQLRSAQAAWQVFVKAQLDEHHELRDAGFRQEARGLFFPIRLVPKDLADAYHDALDDALHPVDTALNTLIQVFNHLDGLVQASSLYFPAQQQ